MKTYEIWIEVEEYDSETDEYRTVEEMTVPLRFDSLDKAIEVFHRLHDDGCDY